MADQTTTRRLARRRTIPLVVVAGLMATSMLDAGESVKLHSGRITGEVLDQSIGRYWVQFGKTGDPNVDGLPEWPKYGDNAAYIELGDEIKANSAFRVQEFELLSEL